MKQIIDIDTWERRENYNFFKGYLTSWYNVTSEIDCTLASSTARKLNHSFFLYYSYAILRAINEIKEFRYRNDNEGNVVLYDDVDIVTPIAVPGKTFSSVRIPLDIDFKKFYATATDIINNLPENAVAYKLETEIVDSGIYNVFLLSATPKLYFSSMGHTVMEAKDPCKYPITTVGKVVSRGDRLVFPFTIYMNHAFVDGAHLSILMEKIEKYLNEIALIE